MHDRAAFFSSGRHQSVLSVSELDHVLILLEPISLMHKGKFVPLTPYLLCSAARLRDDVVIFAAQHVIRKLFAG
jgi:hypothetical protein